MSKFNKLSRAEMKNVMGGTVTSCRVDGCTLYVISLGYSLGGSCASGSGNCVCIAQTDSGTYTTSNGGTTCNA